MPPAHDPSLSSAFRLHDEDGWVEGRYRRCDGALAHCLSAYGGSAFTPISTSAIRELDHVLAADEAVLLPYVRQLSDDHAAALMRLQLALRDPLQDAANAHLHVAKRFTRLQSVRQRLEQYAGWVGEELRQGVLASAVPQARLRHLLGKYHALVGAGSRQPRPLAR